AQVIAHVELDEPVRGEDREGDKDHHHDGQAQRQARPRGALGAQVARGDVQLEARCHGYLTSSAAAASGRKSGNGMTSRIEAWLHSSMTSRSMPMPSPAVGGRPYSRARQ